MVLYVTLKHEIKNKKHYIPYTDLRYIRCIRKYDKHEKYRKLTNLLRFILQFYPELMTLWLKYVYQIKKIVAHMICIVVVWINIPVFVTYVILVIQSLSKRIFRTVREVSDDHVTCMPCCMCLCYVPVMYGNTKILVMLLRGIH